MSIHTTNEPQVWYSMINNQPYPTVSEFIQVTNENFDLLKDEIHLSIDSFNSEHDWNGMWTLDDVTSRLNLNHKLFLGIDDNGPLSHMWSDKGYLYNVYVSKRRSKGYGVRFVHNCLNHITETNITVYCDEWNTRAQKFTEDLGFTKK